MLLLPAYSCCFQCFVVVLLSSVWWTAGAGQQVFGARVFAELRAFHMQRPDSSDESACEGSLLLCFCLDAAKKHISGLGMHTWLGIPWPKRGAPLIILVIALAAGLTLT